MQHLKLKFGCGTGVAAYCLKLGQAGIMMLCSLLRGKIHFVQAVTIHTGAFPPPRLSTARS